MKVLIVLLSVLICLEIYDRLKRILTPMFGGLSFWFANRKADEPEVETPEEEFIAGNHDVEAFRERIKLMRDENGLYDVPEFKPVTDFTGVEIITPSAEMAVENRIGR